MGARFRRKRQKGEVRALAGTESPESDFSMRKEPVKREQRKKKMGNNSQKICRGPHRRNPDLGQAHILGSYHLATRVRGCKKTTGENTCTQQ